MLKFMSSSAVGKSPGDSIYNRNRYSLRAGTNACQLNSAQLKGIRDMQVLSMYKMTLLGGIFMHRLSPEGVFRQ